MIIWYCWVFNIMYINLGGLVPCMQMEGMVYTNTGIPLEIKTHFLIRGNLIKFR